MSLAPTHNQNKAWPASTSAQSLPWTLLIEWVGRRVSGWVKALACLLKRKQDNKPDRVRSAHPCRWHRRTAGRSCWPPRPGV